jgi:hypothetical protein
MQKQYANHQIDELLERFMQGETSLVEEQLLADYFRLADNIPARWVPYRTMFRYFDEGMPLEPLHENAAHGATSDAVETPSDAVEMPLNTLEMTSDALEMPLAVPYHSLRRVLNGRWGRALLAAALVLLLGLVPLLHHEEKPVTQPVIAEHRRQPVVKPFVAQRQMPAEQPSSADKTSLVQPSAVVVKKAGRKDHSGMRTSRAATHGTKGLRSTETVEKADADSYSEYVEEQVRTIHNDVVEATYELLPVDKDLLHLATDENGLVKIVPTTAVHEL